jgi:hypothetical protein
MRRSAISRYDHHRDQLHVFPFLPKTGSRSIVSYDQICPGVNSRVSDAYDWIRASVCAMSNYPPDEMCSALDDESIATNREPLFSTWVSWICQGLAVACCVIGTLLLVKRLGCFRESYNRRYCITPTSTNDDDAPSDELSKIKRHQSWTKMRSYDSTELEPLPVAE